MIKVLNLSLFVVLSRSLQHQIKRKIGVSSANMVDYNKFQYIDIEGESIETSLLESLVSKVQPIESAYDTIKSGGYKVISIGEASHGTEEFYRYRCDLTKKVYIHINTRQYRCTYTSKNVHIYIRMYMDI